MSIGILLLEFFHYYGFQFDFDTDVVSIRRSEDPPPPKTEWKTYPIQLIHSHFGFIEFSSRILAFFSIYFSLIEYTWDKYAICVEDPFEVDFNLSRNVSQETLHDIIFQFRTAYIDLCGQPDLSILWEKAVFE